MKLKRTTYFLIIFAVIMFLICLNESNRFSENSQNLIIAVDSDLTKNNQSIGRKNVSIVDPFQAYEEKSETTDLLTDANKQVSVGESITFDETTYESGSIKVLAEYLNGFLVRKRIYFESGQLKDDVFFDNGAIDGFSTTYYETGIPRIRFKFDHGTMVDRAERYFPSGNIERITELENGKPVSATLYSRNGSTVECIEYFQGKENAVYHFHKNVDGKLIRIGISKNGSFKWIFDNQKGIDDRAQYAEISKKIAGDVEINLRKNK